MMKRYCSEFTHSVNLKEESVPFGPIGSVPFEVIKSSGCLELTQRDSHDHNPHLYLGRKIIKRFF